MAKKSTKIRESFSDRVLEAITTVILILILILIGYPLIYVVSCSFSSSEALSNARVLLWPVDFSLKGYEFVLQYEMVWTGYRNTIFYTITGTFLTMVFQILIAYPLSKSNYQGKSVVLKLLLVAMMFGAGMIPTFILKLKLGLVGTVWAIILTGLVGINNVFMLRNCFRHSIPGELFDAAKIDGANDFQCLFKLAIPLGKATISVLVLYAAVARWNEYFNSLIYLVGKPHLWPLQMFLRDIMTSAADLDPSQMSPAEQQAMRDSGIEQIRYCLIVISTVPVLAMYAVVQKYFQKGVMVGSVKG